MTPRMRWSTLLLFVIGGYLASGWLVPPQTWAHCDTMDGPVVAAARKALDRGDLTPVLKWVSRDQETEVRAAFQQTLAVRTKGKEARDLADRFFFETVVRLHRATEGEPYTGLQPAGTDPGPIVREADQALRSGDVQPLVQHLTDQVAKGIKERFHAAVETGKRAEENVAAGREFVKAYVEFMHYAERLHQAAAGHGHHHGDAAKGKPTGGDHH